MLRLLSSIANIMTFYLQFGISANKEGYQQERYFLDDYTHPKCELLQTIIANSWIEARTEVIMTN